MSFFGSRHVQSGEDGFPMLQNYILRHPKSNALKPQMDPHLAELLASANADHVFERGTGNFDLLIDSLTHSLREPKNAPFYSQILAAIQRLQSMKEIDPVRANTRKEMRKHVIEVLNELSYGWLNNPNIVQLFERAINNGIMIYQVSSEQSF